jgi:ceramide glucosyltransferase
MLSALAAIPVALGSAWITLGLLATSKATRRRRFHEPVEPAPVSVLKPLCGAESGLEENLESLFTQDYPRYELVFGAVDADDPGLTVARRVAARHPDVPSRFVVHPGGPELNPKVRNLRGMLPAATHDLVVISDSSVRAPAHYLRELVGVQQASGAGLVTNLFATAEEETLGAALDSVQAAGFVAAGVALPTLLGEAAVVGKSTLFSREEFSRLGGFERLADVLAEDFVLGKMYQHARRKVAIAPTVVESVTHELSLWGFVKRHLRWSMMRWRLEPLAAALEPLTRPLALAPFAIAAFGPKLGIGWTIAAWTLRDVGGHLLLRGPRRAWVPIVLAPISDLLMLGVWAFAPIKQHVSWRGTRLRLGAGTLLYREAPAPKSS